MGSCLDWWRCPSLRAYVSCSAVKFYTISFMSFFCFVIFINNFVVVVIFSFNLKLIPSVYWLNDWLTDALTDSLTRWLADSLTRWLADSSVHIMLLKLGKGEKNLFKPNSYRFQAASHLANAPCRQQPGSCLLEGQYIQCIGIEVKTHQPFCENLVRISC